MKFTCSVTIDQPLDRVVQLFKDPSKLKEYQPGFLRKEHISGTPWEEGAVSKMYYEFRKGEMELTETVMKNDLPHEFLGHYHHKHMDNTMLCRFIPIDDNTTRYDTGIEYTAFRGFMPKMMAKLFPGMFRKQVQKWLDNFKAYAEKGSA